MKNPYNVGNRIERPDDFFGRETEIQGIYNRISGRQCSSIVGERRVGKTSLLYHLYLDEIKKINFETDERKRFIYVYYNLQRLSTEIAQITPAGFIKRLFREIESKIRRDDNIALELKSKFLNFINIDIIDDELVTDKFFEYLKVIRSHDLYIVLFIDEFDVLTSSTYLKEGFFKYLRALAVEDLVTYATTSQKDLYELCCSTNVEGSEFYNIFVPFCLGLFSHDTAMELIEIPSSRANCSLKNEANFVLDCAGYHPYLLQMMCFEVFQQKQQKHKELSLKAYKKIEDNFYDNASSHFDYIWNHLTVEEKNGLANLANDDSSFIISDNVSKCLKIKGYLVLNDQKNSQSDYKIFSRKFKEFILTQYFLKEENISSAKSLWTNIVNKFSAISAWLIGKNYFWPNLFEFIIIYSFIIYYILKLKNFKNIELIIGIILSITGIFITIITQLDKPKKEVYSILRRFFLFILQSLIIVVIILLYFKLLYQP